MTSNNASGSRLAASLGHFQSVYDRHRFLDLYALTSEYWTAATDVNSLPVEAIVLGARTAYRLGGERLSRWLLREALRRDPSNPLVRYFAQRANPRRVSLLDELKDFIAHPDIGGEDPELRASWYAAFAYTWAMLRDFDRAHDCLRLAHALAPDHGWVLHLESGVHGLADRWADALQSAERAFAVDPGAPYAAHSLGLALVNLGRVEESAARLTAVAEAGQSYEIVLTACWHRCALAETLDGERRGSVLDGAGRLAARLPGLMPLADRETLKHVARTNLDIAGLADDRPAIERWAVEARSPYHRQLLASLARNAAGERVRLSFRRTIQKYDSCVPSSLAAAMSAGDMHISANEMAADLTFGGTPEWAAADWLRGRGYHVRFFSASPDVATRLIRNRIAFTVSWEGDEAGHAVAVVGFDERAETFLVHDPNSFRSAEYLFAAFDPRMSPLGIRAMAVVRPEQAMTLDALLPPESAVAEAAQEHSKQLTLHGPSAARQVVADLIARFPSHPGSRYLEAVQALEDGQAGQALVKLKELIRQFPRSPHVRVRYMQACHSVGNRALVRQTLKDIVEAGMLPGLEAQQDWIYPPDRYIYEYADLLRLSSDTSQNAESLLLRLIGRQPVCAGAWHNLADLLWDKRDEPGALLGFRISAGLAENDEHAARACADALAALGREEEASRWLESRARGFRNPLHAVSPWITWIAFLEDRGYPERALSACDEALAQQGAPAELLAFAVPFFARMGDWTRAEADLERLRDAGLPHAFFEAATRLHRMRGDLESAARSATAWVTELPRSIDARHSLLDIIASREGPEAAVRASRQWMLENGDHEGFEEAYCAQLDRAAAPPGKKYRVLLGRLKRNPEDAWAWLQLTYVCLNYYEIADDKRKERLEPRIVRFLAECDRTSAGAVMTARAHALWSELRGDWAGAVSRSLESIALAPESFYSYRLAWDCSSRLGADGREDLWRRLEPVFLGFPGRLTIAREVAGLLAERFGVAAAETSVAMWRTARPDDPDILEAAADLLVDHGHGRSDAARAIGLLEPAVRRYPFHSGLRFSLANAYHRAGRDAEAEAVLAEITRRHPDNSAAGIRLAVIMSRRGDEQGALESLDRMMAAEPRIPDPLDARAEILIDRARFVEAVRDIEGGLSRLSSDARWRDRAVALLIQCGAGDKAIQAARGGVAADPGNAFLWAVLGRTLLGMRQYAEVGEIESCFRKSLALNGCLYEPADSLARLLAEQRRYDEASNLVRGIETRLPDPSPARGRLAWIRRQSGQLSEAVADLANVLEAAPWYGWGWSLLMDWLEEDAAWDRTRQLLQNIPPPMFTNTDFRLRRLWLLERAQADVTQLDEEWARLLGDFPEDVSLHTCRYDVLVAAGRWQDADAVIEAIVRAERNEPYVLARRCEALARDDHKSAALEIALRICFLPADGSVWPSEKAWDVARKQGFADDLSLRFRERLKAGDKPALHSLSRMAAYVMRDATKLRNWPFPSHRRPRGGALDLAGLVDDINRAPWDGSEHRAVVYYELCDHGYVRLVAALSDRIGATAVTAANEWAQIGRALLEGHRYAAARKFLGAWRERTGVAMWMVANYIISLSRRRRDQLQERLSSARDALAGLPHDNCANYLAHIQAEACARLGRQDLFLETLASHARYFDRDLEEGEFFWGRDRHLLTGISRLAGELAQHRGGRARVALWKFRLRGGFERGFARAAPPLPKDVSKTNPMLFLYIATFGLYMLMKVCFMSDVPQSGIQWDQGPQVGQSLPVSPSFQISPGGREQAGETPRGSLLPGRGAGDAAPFSLAVQDRDLVARVLQWTSEVGSYGATGEIVNRGTKAFHFVMVRVEFCDRAGRVVGALTTEGRRDETVLPGQALSFTVKGYGKLDFATARASVAYATEVK